MRGPLSRRATALVTATIVTSAVVATTALTGGVAHASTTVLGSGTVTCTATTAKAVFSKKLTLVPKRVRVTLSASLTCTEGETGNSSVVISSGTVGGTAVADNVTCMDADFGAGAGNINWISPTGTVKKSHWTANDVVIMDGNTPILDLHPGNTALTNVVINGVLTPRSYTGADLDAHLVGDPATGGLCGADAYNVKATGVGGTSSLTIKPPNPNGQPIDHVVVLMQENRSADDYLAHLNDQGQPDFEAQPLIGNPDPTNPGGPPILPFHKTSVCENSDLDHSWDGTHKEVDGGAMDGFTKQNANALDPTGSRAMGYYDQTDMPFYYGMYNTFATGDRYFSSVLSQTYPNREYLFAGTSFGHVTNAAGPFVQPSVFELLDAHSISWKIYVSQPQYGSYAGTFFKYVHDRASTHVFPIAQYYQDLANNQLPAVTYIDPDQFDVPHHTENDEHPPSDIELGQQFSSNVINGLMASAAWPTSALFFTYDEHGGYYDHVTPPAAPIPDNIAPVVAPGDPFNAFDQYGVRVPVAVVSPFSKPHFVSHVVHDHTSILKFVEQRFGLPSLTNRDAQADPMLEMLDFANPTFTTPPSLPAATVDQAKLAACP